MTELYNFATAGYQPATQNFIRRYFESVDGKWDGKPRLAYLLPHFMRASRPFDAALALELWTTGYIDQVLNMNTFNQGKVKKEHYVLDFNGKNADFCYYLVEKLNPIIQEDKTRVLNYNAQLSIKSMLHNGLVFDNKPDVSKQYASLDQLNIYDEMTNCLDNMPIAIARAVKVPEVSHHVGRIHFLSVDIDLTYKLGNRNALIDNFNKITGEVRDQLWAEALYMYKEEQKDVYYIDGNGNTITDFSDPAILYD